jgi:hypothetical protein
MSKKVDRALHGPSWAEVILGAVLSIVLGVVLGALLLILRPPIVAKEVPKEPVRGAIYYVEGSRDGSKAKQALAKRKSFVEGQSVTVSEEEINSLIAPATPAPAPKAGEKKDAKATPATSDTLATGAPNVRIADGKLQVGVPVTMNVLGLEQKVIVHARGGFVKEGDMFVYEPEKLYIGSCPVERLPYLSSYVRNKVLAAQPIPEDIKASWVKLANVSIEGKSLKLTMP